MERIKKIFKNKLRIIIILIILVVLFLIFLLINYFKNYKSYTDLFIERIKNGEVKYIYVTDSENCETCVASDNYLKYYKKKFNLNYEVYDVNSFSTSECEKLFTSIDLSFKDVTLPSFVIIDKNGNTLINEIDNEENLQSYLLEKNVIEKNSFDKENYINDVEFENLVNKGDKFLMFIRNDDYRDYAFREKIYDLSLKYGFTYYTCVYMYKNGATASIFLNYNVQNVKVPILFVVEKGKIIDYINSSSTVNIEQFLRKNGFIK
ncbi:MAG: ATP-dependent metallopeptidase FtsH/Yme1/Tma family protein [Bacilli bacterium]|nr:ATP-dependent metallopeptidase FtsH/Yme1/Tma family protein [Bacilli bacterium]